MIEHDDPIESYLDEVLRTAPGPARQVRHTLAEVEDHLLAAAEQAEAAGLPPAQARLAAVRALGPSTGVLDRRSPASWLRPPRALRRRLVLTAAFLAGWGGVAVGVAGALALAVKAVWGPGAIATAFPAGSYSSADCARWLTGYPQYGTCQQAMVADHADDVIRNAAVALVLGLLALGVRAMLRRAWHDGSRPVLESAIGAALALLVALGSAGIAFDSVTVTHGHGAGQPIAFAVAAALACVGLGRAAMRAAARPLLARRPA